MDYVFASLKNMWGKKGEKCNFSVLSLFSAGCIFFKSYPPHQAHAHMYTHVHTHTSLIFIKMVTRSSFLKIILFLYLFLAVLGLCWHLGFALSSCGAWASHSSGFFCCGARALVCPGFSSCGTWSPASMVLVQPLRCPTACGIFPDQGSNLCLLHREVGSYPLSHQGSPPLLLLLLSRFSRVRLCATPRDGNPSGSPVPGILQARTLAWVAISFSNVPL